MTDSNDTKIAAMSGVDSSDLFEELDGLYAEFKVERHQSIWGGRYEIEESARRRCSELAKEIFDKTMEHLEARSSNTEVSRGVRHERS